MRKVFIYLQYPRVVLADVFYYKTQNITYGDETLMQVIDKDMLRYRSHSSSSYGVRLLNELLLSNKIFRTQFYFRIGQNEKLGRSFFFTFLRTFLPPMDNLEIGINKTGFVGGGLKIVHKSGCVLSAHKIGENLTVFQGVTIGDSQRVHPNGFKNPIIGDNVVVFANSVIGGGISIGNNVIIGAGSVVLKDVPDNCTVEGNPARIVKMNGENVDIKL